MILHQYPGRSGFTSVSPPCMKVEMALRSVGADYRVNNLTSPAKARKVSVTGRLPVLEIDGERIPDSIVILDRLERRFPEAPLWPADPGERIRDRLWEHFGTDVMYWPGFYLRWVDPDTSPRSMDALFGGLPWPFRLVIRTTFVPRQRRRARLHGIGGKPPQAVREDMERALRMVVEGLSGGPYLQGRKHPGRGDLACASLIAQAGFLDSLPETMALIRANPPLVDYTASVFAACRMDVPGWLRETAAG